MPSKLSDQGRFQILIHPGYKKDSLHLSIIGLNDKFEVVRDNDFLSEYPEVDHRPLLLDSVQIATVVQRSTMSQLRNAYVHLVKDTFYTLGAEPKKSFSFDQVYRLDEYTRFPQLRDIFVEYIPTVAVRKRKDNYSFKVALQHSEDFFDRDPLVLLDGVPVAINQLMKISPTKIESVGIITNRFFYGPLVSDGIVSFHTYPGNLDDFIPTNTVTLDYKPLQMRRVYHYPNYEDNPQPRIPDLRAQLYWQPNVKVGDEGNLPIHFYTSDQPGLYELAIEGFGDNGEAICIRQYFEVKN